MVIRFQIAVICFVAASVSIWTARVHATESDSNLSEAEVSRFHQPLQGFLSSYCNDCHAEGQSEGGLAIDQLSTDLTDPAAFAKWERIYDRVKSGEMPPKDYDLPNDKSRESFIADLHRPLNAVHRTRRSTVLRRLNRREYENTMNDVFGTSLDLQSMLPEDARSHEFDNVGDALGLSMVHLQRYMDAANLVLDEAIASTVEAPQSEHLSAWYKDTREAETHVGKAWKLLDDGFMVRFEGGGYPSGMMRGTNVDRPGRYRIHVTGYAYQSESPIVCSIGGTSFAPGSEKPIYGFVQFPPGGPTTVELEAWIDQRYMIAIEPHGITHPNRYKQTSIDEHKGPGLAIGEVTLDGPIIDEFPTRGHQMIFAGVDRQEVMPRNPKDRQRSWYKPKFTIESEQPDQIAERAIKRVAAAMFRKPATDGQLQPYLVLFRERMADGDSIEQALRTAVTAMCCSPAFLYFQEEPGSLDDYALADRLSFFLNRTRPDETLSALASSAKLSDPATLQQQTDRLIRHPHFQRFLVDLTDSWLDLREMDFTAPDQTLFPEFDPFLRYSMPRETLAFVREVIESNHPIRTLVAPDFAMVNCRLAEHYGLPKVDSTEIQKVPLPQGSVRGGLLTQASILKVTANGTNTSPVKRGAWVLERIAGVTPPPPPPGVPGVEPDIRGATTLRELLDQHRNADNCRACHQVIDPPGFALESFNPIGGYRERYRSLGEGNRPDTQVRGRRVNYRLGPSVDPSGELQDGVGFATFGEFQKLLADQDRMLARTFVTKLLTFATGREMGFSDRQEIEQIVDAAAGDHYRAKDLLHAVVASEIFNTK
ncbi:DUF1592 domain-containing protein [Stieleria sp. JC731]|uniref:DUF1592 domain-containing protein n=1 Tax=Pirellulaceae TaxID=2691357 RepID=UPI001E4F6EF2|nr:DUF1592 domain-containing protein [Stieleria sp. JC731]MCC9600477.1 DUF1592 domain-containing protein [Stieleria sp. JC731]